jgi:single-stranded-DNA-specific exonuclease
VNTEIWEIRQTDADVKKMAEVLGVSEMTARVLANRGVRSKHAAIKYLRPSLEHCRDAEEMADMAKAAKIIARAKNAQAKTVIFGDYDVDGVMGITILYKTLKKFGFENVSYYVPKRDDEGYGLSMKSVERLCIDHGAKLIITCDNGISASYEIARAKELGAAVVVFDHHEPPFTENNGVREDIIPAAAAVVNPKRKDCAYPFKHLCAAAVAYKFAEYFHRVNGAEFTDRNEFLALTAVATHCDIVDLTGENRILAKIGADIINSGDYGNIGLKTLLAERGLSDKKVGDYEIGFIIGPCINASGRVASARTAVELFTAKDGSEQAGVAKALALELVGYNNERKILTAEAAETALLLAAGDEHRDDKILVLYLPDAHESIAGIVAGRVRESRNRPAIVFTKSTGDNILKGSGRSTEAYNIFEGLFRVRHLFVKFGGHAMAAGISMPFENLGELRKVLNENCVLTEDDFIQRLRADAEISINEITINTAREIENLSPFGKGNERPLFCAFGVLTEQIDVIGENRQSLRFTFTRGGDGSRSEARPEARLKAVWFNKLDEFCEVLRSAGTTEKMIDAFTAGVVRKLAVKLDIAFTVGLNEYKGGVSEQLRIVAVRKAK